MYDIKYLDLDTNLIVFFNNRNDKEDYCVFISEQEISLEKI